MQQQQDTTSVSATVIQMSRPVPVIKRACSPPLLELEPPPPPLLEVAAAHGVHFLTPGDATTNVEDSGGCSQSDDAQLPRSKNELLEYLIRTDGSVTCKLCGEILASRTHWYRHKYKLHASVLSTSAGGTTNVSASGVTVSVTPVTAVSHPQPAPLYKCELCNVFFKSKKGYTGHVTSRHVSSVVDEDCESTLGSEEVPPVERESDRTKRRDSGSGGSSVAALTTKRNDVWEQQREKEEKLVADIIDRVRRECEAQGAMVSRRGYSRRSTVMNTCN